MPLSSPETEKKIKKTLKRTGEDSPEKKSRGKVEKRRDSGHDVKGLEKK